MVIEHSQVTLKVDNKGMNMSLTKLFSIFPYII